MRVVELTALILTAIAVVPALAHVLELPGKMRLTEPEYRIVQRIYYPGFTLAGVAEGAAPVAALALLLLRRPGEASFALTAVALLCLIGTQLIYWLVVQPVNKIWMRGVRLERAGASFFGIGKAQLDESDFFSLRRRWEYAHGARAALVVASLLSLVLAATRPG